MTRTMMTRIWRASSPGRGTPHRRAAMEGGAEDLNLKLCPYCTHTVPEPHSENFCCSLVAWKLTGKAEGVAGILAEHSDPDFEIYGRSVPSFTTLVPSQHACARIRGSPAGSRS